MVARSAALLSHQLPKVLPPWHLSLQQLMAAESGAPVERLPWLLMPMLVPGLE